MNTPVDPSKLKVAELKTELSSRGLDTKGKKEELVTRLTTALSSDSTKPSPAAGTSSSSQSNTGTSSSSTAQQGAAASTSSSSSSQPTQQPGGAQQKGDAGAAEGADAAAAADQGTVEEVDLSEMSELERRKRRAEKFGIPFHASEEDRKKQRAERFQLAGDGAPLTPINDEQKKAERLKRFNLTQSPSSARSGHSISGANIEIAARLGLPVGSSAVPAVSSLPSVNDPERLTARMQRFGLPTKATPSAASTEEEEEKKRKRAERFKAAGENTKRLRVDKPLEAQTK